MPVRQTLITIQCPHCGKTLVQGRPNCQFCGALLPAAYAAVPVHIDDRGQTPWQEVAYKIMCGGMIVLGALAVLQAALSNGYITGVFGGADLILGIGLLAENELAQGIVKFFAWLNVAAAAALFLVSFMWFGRILEPGGWVYLVGFFLGLGGCIYWGFMIYLINYFSDW